VHGWGYARFGSDGFRAVAMMWTVDIFWVANLDDPGPTMMEMDFGGFHVCIYAVQIGGSPGENLNAGLFALYGVPLRSTPLALVAL